MTFHGPLGGKNADTKKQILSLCISDDWSIAELSKELSTSIPTITKLVGELIEENYLEDMGKHGTTGGRRPSIFGLNPAAGHLIGVDIGNKEIRLAITDFKGRVESYTDGIAFTLDNSEESFARLCDIITRTVKQAKVEMSDVISCGVNLSGRVNSFSGYSLTYMLGEYRPLTEILSSRLGVNVTIENDSRAMTYAEYLTGCNSTEKNVLFFNVNWGLGMGMIVDGKLHYGKSGFSGEIGHFPMLNNDVICRCGKRGCLETGASASAMYRIINERLREGRSSILSDKIKKGKDININDMIDAALAEDVLVIEVIEEIGSTLGQAIAGMIKIFNPEVVIIGGRLSRTKDYLMLPVKSAINKHSLSFVSQDTAIRLSKLGDKAGAIGACLLTRSKFLQLI